MKIILVTWNGNGKSSFPYKETTLDSLIKRHLRGVNYKHNPIIIIENIEILDPSNCFESVYQPYKWLEIEYRRARLGGNKCLIQKRGL